MFWRIKHFSLKIIDTSWIRFEKFLLYFSSDRQITSHYLHQRAVITNLFLHQSQKTISPRPQAAYPLVWREVLGAGTTWMAGKLMSEGLITPPVMEDSVMTTAALIVDKAVALIENMILLVDLRIIRCATIDEY